MVQFSNLQFSTSLGVMYELKQKYNHSKLTETYKLLENAQDLDLVIEILNISYNKANNAKLNENEFTDLLDQNSIGFIKLTELFTKVVEGIMFNGMSPEEVEQRKNLMKNLKQ